MHNNLQFAHQLRVLTNYGDINGGSNGGGWTGAGVGEEGGGGRERRVCPKTQDTRGMSARCYIVQRQGIFAPVFPRSKIICLPSLIRSVPRSTYEFRQFRRNPRVYIYIYLNIRSLSRYSILSGSEIPCLNHFFDFFSSDEKDEEDAGSKRREISLVNVD